MTAQQSTGPNAPVENKGRTFFSRVFDYPSPLVLAIQATLILLLTQWVSYLLLVIGILMSTWYFIRRVIYVIQNPEDDRSSAALKTVLITGASTGIGQALAIEYAQKGASTIYVTARGLSNLTETIEKCTKANSQCKIVPLALDVTDKDSMNAKLRELDQQTPIDIVIANAGISPEQQKGKPQEEIFRNTYNTNITGVLNTIFPFYDSFVQRRSGHFVLVSSIASFGSIAHPAYSSSKALCTVLGQGLRRDLKAFNVNVTVVCPGFIYSKMTKDRDDQRRAEGGNPDGIGAKVKNYLGLGGLPFIRSVEEAAEVIVKGIGYNIDVIIFPFRLGLFAWILRFMPFFFQDKVGEFMAKLAYRGTGTASTDPTSGQKKKD